MNPETPAPLAVQLYSVREALQTNFAGTLEQIAAMGYAGVETFRFDGIIDAGEARRIFDRLGLKVTSAHLPLPLDENQAAVLEQIEALGTDHLVVPWMEPRYYESPEGIRKVGAIFNRALAVCEEHGLRLSIHNHDFEFRLLDGRPAILHLKDQLNDRIGFELDTYLIQVAGQDPAETVRAFGEAAPLLHIKDGPATHGEPMVAVGEGVVDVPAVIAAGAGQTDWLIVELDACATDMLEALEKSYAYLTQHGLARGK